MIKRLKELWRVESGVTAIEYALIASLIALAIIAGASILGNTIGNQFNKIANEINNAG